MSTAFASKKEVEAAFLIERAKQLSDIRAEGSSPFRLNLSFKVTQKKEGTVLQGIYTETWASQTQWRRDTIIADSHRIEVAAGQERWLVESSQPLPETARNLPALLALGRLQPEVWKPERMETRKLNGATLRCIGAAPEERAGWHIAAARQKEIPSEAPTLCFDASSGLLAAEIEPQPDTYEQYTGSDPSLVRCCKTLSHTSSCFFADYQKFGERGVARSYHCIEDGHPILDGVVTELVSEANFDPSLFAVAGAVKERTGCPDLIRPPQGVYQPEPVNPRGSGMVTITLNVRVDGAAGNLAVVSSPNRSLEKSALDAVRKWRFKPASCDGEPVSAKIAVEVDMHVR